MTTIWAWSPPGQRRNPASNAPLGKESEVLTTPENLSPRRRSWRRRRTRAVEEDGDKNDSARSTSMAPAHGVRDQSTSILRIAAARLHDQSLRGLPDAEAHARQTRPKSHAGRDDSASVAWFQLLSPARLTSARFENWASPLAVSRLCEPATRHVGMPDLFNDTPPTSRTTQQTRPFSSARRRASSAAPTTAQRSKTAGRHEVGYRPACLGHARRYSFAFHRSSA